MRFESAAYQPTLHDTERTESAAHSPANLAQHCCHHLVVLTWGQGWPQEHRKQFCATPLLPSREASPQVTTKPSPKVGSEGDRRGLNLLHTSRPCTARRGLFLLHSPQPILSTSTINVVIMFKAANSCNKDGSTGPIDA